MALSFWVLLLGAPRFLGNLLSYFREAERERSKFRSEREIALALVTGRYRKVKEMVLKSCQSIGGREGGTAGQNTVNKLWTGGNCQYFGMNANPKGPLKCLDFTKEQDIEAGWEGTE